MNIIANFGVAMDMIQIRLLIKENKLTEALVELNAMIDREPDNAEALFERGRIYWRLGERSKAMSDYCRADALEPGGPASVALDQARQIEAFFNPDLLNP